MAYIYDLVDTWNDGATTFTAVKMNVTDTASNAASLLMDLQVGTVSKFRVEKSGGITALGNIFALGGCLQYGSGVGAGNTYRIGFSSTANSYDTMDAFLTRRAAANLRLGAADAAAPVAQTLSVQSVVAGTTNTAGTNLTITGSQGTGTGAGGSIIFQVAPAGSSGSAQNALATALTINSNKTVTMDAGVASAPSINFGDSTTGFFRAGTQIIGVTTNGTSFVRFDATNGVSLRSDANIGWASNTSYSSYDVSLFRDAANTLALRNGTNAQAFNVYETFTSDSNFSRLRTVFSTSKWIIEAGSGAGGGNNRDIQLQNNQASQRVIIAANMIFDPDNTYDIGASGGTRPRSIYTGSSAYFGGDIFCANGIFFGGASYTKGYIYSNSDGVWSLNNSTSTSFGRLQFGGTDANFPALKRNATALETKLADDSAYAPHAMQYLDVTDGVTAPASATGRARIYVDTADGDLKVIFADGTVKTIVTDT